MLQLKSNDENITCLLNETLGTANNPLPFSSKLNYLNDYTYSSIQSLVFPTLFSFGTYCNRNIYVTLTESVTLNKYFYQLIGVCAIFYFVNSNK